MPFGRFNQLVQNFEDDNSSARQSIVFLHSLGTELRLWNGVIGRFGPTVRTLRCDLRGHGLSDAPPGPYSIDDLTDDVAALMHSLGIEKALVVGLSVGGMVAQRLAARHPHLTRALVLSNTGHRIGSAETWSARMKAVGDGGLIAIADQVTERWFSKKFREESPIVTAGYRNMLLRTPVEGYVSVLALLRDTDLSPSTRLLTLPTLCLTGEVDTVTTPELTEALSRLISGSRFEVIPGTGHLPCVERPDLFADRIMAFAKEIGCG